MQKRILAFALLATLFLTGCAYNPEVSTISIGKEGDVESYIVEEFTAAYYDAEELRNNVLADIQKVNDEYGQMVIELTEYELLEGGILKAGIQYQSAKVYEEFNEETLYVGLWKDAIAEGYKVNAAIEDEEYRIVIFSEPVSVRVPKKIVYVSEGLQPDGKKAVTVTDKEKEIYYIIYE